MTAKKFISLTAAATMVVTSLGLAAPASARDRGYDNYRGSNYSRDYRYQDTRGYRNDYRNNYQDRRVYYSGDRYRCKNDGSTGTILGAIAGGLIGHQVAGRGGDKTAGVIIGGAVGAVAGRAIDKSDSRCR